MGGKQSCSPAREKAKQSPSFSTQLGCKGCLCSIKIITVISQTGEGIITRIVKFKFIDDASGLGMDEAELG